MNDKFYVTRETWKSDINFHFWLGMFVGGSIVAISIFAILKWLPLY